MRSAEPRLTRRDVLGRVAAAGAGALTGPAAAGAGALIGPAAAGAVKRSRNRVFSRWLGALRGPSPVITAAAQFGLAGVQWAVPEAARIELRARSHGGRWSPWALASVRGHVPDGSTSPRGVFGDPLWFGRADQLQLRSARPVGGVRLHFVAAAPVSELTARDASAPLAQPVLPAGPGQPPIIARSAWAGAEARPGGGPYYGSVALVFVHHTENPNGYSRGEVPAMLLAMFDYHRYTRGYFDIAYNFIIDAFGRIWEARAGGIDEPVIGAHAGGYNAVSSGVAVLGTFVNSVPPPAAISALEELLAWKLSLHGVPTLGKVRVEVNPADAYYTPFAPGQRVSLPRIAGHRDGDQTDCPGDAFYARLPSIRPRVAALAGDPTVLTLVASSDTVLPATPITLAGKLSALHGAPIAGAAIEVQTVPGIGLGRTVSTVTTGADGRWTVPSLTVPRATVLRALCRTAPAAVSDVVVIDVKPVLGLTLTSTSPVRVSGTISPSKPRLTIDVYKLAHGHRKLVSSRRIVVRGGSFTIRPALGVRPRGLFAIVARTGADHGTLAGSSAPLMVTI